MMSDILRVNNYTKIKNVRVDTRNEVLVVTITDLDAKLYYHENKWERDEKARCVVKIFNNGEMITCENILKSDNSERIKEMLKEWLER